MSRLAIHPERRDADPIVLGLRILIGEHLDLERVFAGGGQGVGQHRIIGPVVLQRVFVPTGAALSLAAIHRPLDIAGDRLRRCRQARKHGGDAAMRPITPGPIEGDVASVERGLAPGEAAVVTASGAANVNAPSRPTLLAPQTLAFQPHLAEPHST
jgi:hypothetical protein